MGVHFQPPLPYPEHSRSGGVEGAAVTEVSTVAITDFVLALSVLLGSLLIPFAGLHWMLRLKRRAVAPAAVLVPDAVPGRVK
jgi:hypothetical protein